MSRRGSAYHPTATGCGESASLKKAESGFHDTSFVPMAALVTHCSLQMRKIAVVGDNRSQEDEQTFRSLSRRPVRLGEFFRQYFFVLDREELPFNRAERDWIYRSSAGIDGTVAFGSTRSLTAVATVIFVNCPFPMLEEHGHDAPELRARKGQALPRSAC
jgi:hypothetical protein